MAPDPAILAALDKLSAAIRAYGDPRRAAGEWKQVYRLLQKTSLVADRVGDVVGRRDVRAWRVCSRSFGTLRLPPPFSTLPAATFARKRYKRFASGSRSPCWTRNRSWAAIR